MERITEYSGGAAVIPHNRIRDAAVKLAEYEDEELRWVPVEERLPEPHRDVLVAFMDFGEDTSTYIDCLIDNNGRLTWSTYSGATDKVLAWMPLPEPYSPQN